MTLDALQFNISSAMVVASHHWRRICQATLANYGKTLKEAALRTVAWPS